MQYSFAPQTKHPLQSQILYFIHSSNISLSFRHIDKERSTLMLVHQSSSLHSAEQWHVMLQAEEASYQYQGHYGILHAVFPFFKMTSKFQYA